MKKAGKALGSGLVVTACALLLSCGDNSIGHITHFYNTNFDGTEDPLSEMGAWSQNGLDWTRVVKFDGVAYGTQLGTRAQPRPNRYDDSYAILNGFPRNHKVSVVIHKKPDIEPDCSQEFEILLRWSDSSHRAHGYEINLSFDGGYHQIIRWNGPYGDFTVLENGRYPGLEDGDTFEAEVKGNKITTIINGRTILRIRDDSYADGNPGIGIFRGNCGSSDMFGISSFSATGSG